MPIFLHVCQGCKLRPPCFCGKLTPESPVSLKASYLKKIDLKPLLFRSCDRWNFVVGSHWRNPEESISADSKGSEIVPKPGRPIGKGSWGSVTSLPACHQQNWGASD